MARRDFNVENAHRMQLRFRQVDELCTTERSGGHIYVLYIILVYTDNEKLISTTTTQIDNAADFLNFY